METIVTLALPALLGILAVRLLAVPVRWLLKAAVHSVSGFLCLWILSTVSGFTGISIPINAVTAAAAGFLGVPGIILLAVLEML